MRGLIVHMLHQAPEALPLVQELYQTHRLRNTKPTLSESSRLLKKVLAIVPNTHIVIDGLDELEDLDNAGLLLDELCTLPASLMIFSRPKPLLQAGFPGPELSIEARNEDIVTFVKCSIKANRVLSSLVQDTPELEEEILGNIRDKSKGMYVSTPLALQHKKQPF